MNFASVEKIAKAVLYEGYILYPYRPSSTKNQQRWNFGTLYPRAWAESQRPAEPCRMATECLVRAHPGATIDLRIRFLQFVPSSEGWEQGVERWADVVGINPLSLCGQVPSSRLALNSLAIAGLQPLDGNCEVAMERLQNDLYKLRFSVTNITSTARADAPRSQMLLQSMVSAHVLLGIESGEFISLLDPPNDARELVSQCHNTGSFPVLVGEEGQRSMMLASPIILYDYPQIAPESDGDFFDGTEMDEMLALRVMTLTDEEKRAMRAGDERARQILERTDNLPAEHWMKVHGAIRGMRRVPEDEA